MNRDSEEQSSEVLFFFRGFLSVVLRRLSPPGATAFAQRAPSAGPRLDRDILDVVGTLFSVYEETASESG